MTIDEMKARKRELGYTNEKIAELSDVPLGTVQKIFSGETNSPRYSTLQKLEKVLGAVPYTFGSESMMLTENVYGTDYYDYRKLREKSYKQIANSDFAPVPVAKRIGVAAGKFKVPDDDFFYNDEITDMFEEV